MAAVTHQNSNKPASASSSETFLTITLFTLSFLMLLAMAVDSVSFELDKKGAALVSTQPSLPFIRLDDRPSVVHSRSSAIQTKRQLFAWPTSSDTQFVGWGNVSVDDDNRLQLAGGTLQAVNVETNLLGSCRSSNELSIELTIVPAKNTGNNIKSLVAFCSEDSDNFMLAQIGDEFVFQLKTTNNDAPKEIRFGKLTPGERHHLLLSYRSGELICFLNGEGVLKTSAIEGKLENWQQGKLIIGSNKRSSANWYGLLESMSIHGRTINRNEAFDRYDIARNDMMVAN